MSGEDETERTAPGGVVVVLRGELRQRGAELLGELGASLGTREAHLRLERDRRERLLRALGAALELGKVAQELRRGRDLVAGGEAVLDRRGIGAERAEERRVDHEGARRDAQRALDAATALALLEELQEAGALEGAQVVVERRSGEAEAAGKAGGGVGLALELGEEAPAYRRERRGHLGRIVHHAETSGGRGRGSAAHHGHDPI